MDNRIKQYLFDIEQSMIDIENYMSAIDSFEQYKMNKLIRRAVERELGIIGEAMNRIIKISPSINIPKAKEIISTRNKIIHGYDEVDDVIIYTIVRKHLPVLRKNLDRL